MSRERAVSIEQEVTRHETRAAGICLAHLGGLGARDPACERWGKPASSALTAAGTVEKGTVHEFPTPAGGALTTHQRCTRSGWFPTSDEPPAVALQHSRVERHSASCSRVWRCIAGRMADRSPSCRPTFIRRILPPGWHPLRCVSWSPHGLALRPIGSPV